MRAYRVLVVAFAVVALVAPALAGAQDRPAIVVTPDSKPTLYRAAVQRFADLSVRKDANLAPEFREDIGAALEFSSLFKMLDTKAFLGPVESQPLTGGPSLACADWTPIGADAFVEGQIERDDQRLQVEFRVWDTARCSSLLRKRYRQDLKADPRVLARRIADDVVAAFTGVRGVASTELSFVSDRGGNKEVFVMDAEGTNARAATANRSINNFPNWSPDGDTILYTSYRYQNRPMLFVSTRGRGTPGRVLSKLADRASLYRGVFAPEGNRLAVVLSQNGASDIYNVKTDGSDPRRLTKNGAIDVSPSWSPDGKQIAFVSDRSGTPQIYVMAADGSDVRRLTFDGGYNTNPSWSPDGRWIAYETRVQGQFDIWLIDPDGSVNVPLVTHSRSDEAPTWSPDSRKIAFSSTRRGRADIYVVDGNGENVRRITSNAGNNTSPSWGPFPR